MIQRIQSLYLAIVVVLSVVFNFVPILGFEILQGDQAGLKLALYASGLVETNDVTVTVLNSLGSGDMKPMLLAVIIGVLALVALVLFKNRKLQIRLTKAVMLASLVQVVFVAIQFGANENVVTTLSVGGVLPVINVILAFLASKAIQKDEALVRSVDRIR